MRSAEELGASKRPAAFLVKHPTTRTNHIFMREEQAQVVADEWDVDYHGLYLKRISEIAADYIERTAAPSHVLNEDDAADLQEGRPYQDVLAAKRTAPPTDGLPEFETTAEERADWLANWRPFNATAPAPISPEKAVALLRDLDKAIAFAASETKRTDELRVALKIATDDKLNFLDQISALTAERDREAAARRDAEERLRGVVKEAVTLATDLHKAEARLQETDERWAWLAERGMSKETVIDLIQQVAQAAAEIATLRAALELIADRRLSDPLEFREIARAALATTSTGEGE